MATAAGTEAWSVTRAAVARVFERAGQGEGGALHRLDQTSAELATSADRDADTLNRVREAQNQAWRIRFEDLLSDLVRADDDSVLTAVADELRGLVAEVERRNGGAPGVTGGLLASEVHVRADRGSFAAGVVNGSVRLDPTRPGAVES